MRGKDFLMLIPFVLFMLAALAAIPLQARYDAKATTTALRDSAVTAEALKAGVPVSVAIAVSHVEDWSGDTMARSSTGALGTMQVIPGWWDDSFHDECGDGPLTGLRRGSCVGVRILYEYHTACPSWGATVRQYALGPGIGCRPNYGDAVFEQLIAR